MMASIVMTINQEKDKTIQRLELNLEDYDDRYKRIWIYRTVRNRR